MPSQLPGAWPTSLEDNGVECVDLTGDSPPPRSQARHRPRLQQTPTYVKREPQNMTSAEMSDHNSAHSGRSEAIGPAIHPDQLRQIIATSDPTQVQNVLLNLCKMSPALAGAIARGLAPHSTYARSLISKAPTVKQEPGRSDNPKFHPSPEVEKGLYASNPRSNLAMRRAPDTGPLLSDSDADSEDEEEFDLWKGRRFAGKDSSRASSERVASKTWGASVAGPSQPRIKSERPDSTRTALKDLDSYTFGRITNVSKKCKICQCVFDGISSDFDCVSHPGRKLVQTGAEGERVVIYSCCGSLIDARGCQQGPHEEVSNTMDLPLHKRRRLS
ncbi:hypothetical protein CC80DRAFT_263104 [Byssothecium circinans]|uniref:Uncharacterized protein n=1 Tax=Byssothecium circinans TaxID=147558 RepID=A0A6A5U7N7_9PLEO|nr:hypothetical protein CC80DRAFT_263104 [Byssothecium circinans]